MGCKFMRCFQWLIIIVFLGWACSEASFTEAAGDNIAVECNALPRIINDTLIELAELRRGDILVKPNHNWLPGTSWVKGGSGFGHALIVIEGATGKDSDEVLRKAVIFESHARKVPPVYELRTAKAYQPGTDFRYDNISFSPSRSEYRYRLRSALSESQIDSVIRFILDQQDGLSSWRAQKKIKITTLHPDNPHQTYWYCSHLIWQAFFSVLNVDVDANGGFYVYPNDLIASPYFSNSPSHPESRVRF